MLPVTVLPAAGLLLRLGQPDLLGKYGEVFQFLATAGESVFANLPVIFAVGVAIGLTNGEGVAALSAVVGEVILEAIIYKKSQLIGIPIDMGVFGGIFIGLIVSILYNKFHNISMPKVFGFFSGKRFIPIVTSFVAFIFAVIMVNIWPQVQVAINKLSIMASDSYFGPGFYAAGKRLLIPVGLHHVYYPTFLFQFGEYTVNGIKYFGDSARYFNGDPTAGVFMAAEYPIIMFGLPGAALAIIKTSKKENRARVFGVMSSAAMVSFLTGITEPIEFTFIFVAPILYVFHVGAAFLSGVITSVFNIRLGYTFSASFIDYVLGYKFAENPLLLFIIGPIFFMVYYVVFYSVIRIKNYKTLGREEVSMQEKIVDNYIAEDRIISLVESLGGINNIVNVDACVTRLRVELKNPSKLQKDIMISNGAVGIYRYGANYQIIFGTEAQRIKDEILTYIESKEELKEESNTIIGELQEICISNPISGKVIPLEAVGDDVFSNKIMGDGFCIIPSNGEVKAPFSGEITMVFPTKHAISIKNKYAVELLIHVGIDSIKLNGKGFITYVKTGDKVSEGDLLISFDKELLEKERVSLNTPVIITDSNGYDEIFVDYGIETDNKLVAILTKEGMHK